MTDQNADQDKKMDQDRAEGSAKQLSGKLKEGAGKLAGDAKLENEGRAEQAEGKVQNAWGSAKEKAREFVKDEKA